MLIKLKTPNDRDVLVNLDHVATLQPHPHAGTEITFVSGNTLQVKSSYEETLKLAGHGTTPAPAAQKAPEAAKPVTPAPVAPVATTPASGSAAKV